MQTSIEDLRDLLTAAAQKFVSHPEAEYFAQLWLETHLKKAPRMNPLNEAVDELKVWADNSKKNIERIMAKSGVSIFDMHGLAPSLKIKEIHDDLEKRAKSNGIAATGFLNTSGIITLNLWADGLAKKDLIGIALFDGGAKCTVPIGGTRGIFGTNPMAYAIPTADQPIVLDMATSEIPFFELKAAKENNIPLKPNAAVDRHGRSTKNAADALSDESVANLLPMGGGFKGYGIMLLIEILTGSLIGGMLSTEQKAGWNPSEYGCFLLALDIGSFTDLDLFKNKVSKMCQDIRREPPADGFDKVVVPGDRGMSKLKEAQQKGSIEVDNKIMNALEKLT